MPVAKGHSLVNAGVTIQTVYGATEVGSPTYMLPRESDVKEGNWDWIRFHKGRADIRWIDQHDGTYELQLMVRPHLPVISRVHYLVSVGTDDRGLQDGRGKYTWRVCHLGSL